MNQWISAAIAAGAGLVVGAIAARLVRNGLARSQRDAIRTAAAPLASVVFSLAFIVGLVVALGFVHPDSLDTIPADLFDFLPRLLAAAIVLIGGNVAATLLQTAAQRALRGAGSAERFGPPVVRAVVLAFAVILGAAQLGIDTTIINIAAAAVLFGTATAMALLIGLGGRRVAAEVAAGRAWRTALVVGDRLKVAQVAGVPVDGIIVAIHPTAIELDCEGRSLLVPNSELLNVVVERVRTETDE
jgi:hypothetical protein